MNFRTISGGFIFEDVKVSGALSLTNLATETGITHLLTINDQGELGTAVIPEGGGGESYTDEQVRDVVSAFIQNGTGITWSHDDGGNTLTPTVVLSLAGFDTDDLTEGAVNEYYTEAKVDARVAAHGATLFAAEEHSHVAGEISDFTDAVESVVAAKTKPIAPQTLTSSSTITLDSANGNNGQVTLAHNATLAISNAVAGETGKIKVTQDGTGSRTLTAASGKTADAGAGVIDIESGIGTITLVEWYYDGTSFFFYTGKNFT